MTWMDWLLVFFFVFCALNVISQVGKMRTIITPGTAAVVVTIYGALAVGLLVSHGALG